jgi:hypothetical protein
MANRNDLSKLSELSEAQALAISGGGFPGCETTADVGKTMTMTISGQTLNYTCEEKLKRDGTPKTDRNGDPKVGWKSSPPPPPAPAPVEE